MLVKSGELMQYNVTQILYRCIKMKQLEADNQLFNIIYRLLKFWK